MKKIFKAFGIGVLAILASLGITGCFDDNTTTSTTKTTTTEQVSTKGEEETYSISKQKILSDVTIIAKYETLVNGVTKYEDVDFTKEYPKNTKIKIEIKNESDDYVKVTASYGSQLVDCCIVESIDIDDNPGKGELAIFPLTANLTIKTEVDDFDNVEALNLFLDDSKDTTDKKNSVHIYNPNKYIYENLENSSQLIVGQALNIVIWNEASDVYVTIDNGGTKTLENQLFEKLTDAEIDGDGHGAAGLITLTVAGTVTVDIDTKTPPTPHDGCEVYFDTLLNEGDITYSILNGTTPISSGDYVDENSTVTVNVTNNTSKKLTIYAHTDGGENIVSVDTIDPSETNFSFVLANITKDVAILVEEYSEYTVTYPTSTTDDVIVAVRDFDSQIITSGSTVMKHTALDFEFINTSTTKKYMAVIEIEDVDFSKVTYRTHELPVNGAWALNPLDPYLYVNGYVKFSVIEVADYTLTVTNPFSGEEDDFDVYCSIVDGDSISSGDTISSAQEMSIATDIAHAKYYITIINGSETIVNHEEISNGSSYYSPTFLVSGNVTVTISNS